MPQEDRVHGGIDSWGRGPRRDFEIDDLVLEPFSKAGDAGVQVPSRIVFGVGYCFDCEIGEGVGEEGAEVGGKGTEGVVAALFEEKLGSVGWCGEGLGMEKGFSYLEAVDEA